MQNGLLYVTTFHESTSHCLNRRNLTRNCLKQNNIDIVRNCQKKIAFEFQALFWHVGANIFSQVQRM